MPDISMCNGVSSDHLKCEMKEKCYRHTATPNEFRQSFFMFAPFIIHVEDTRMTQECEYFWETQ